MCYRQLIPRSAASASLRAQQARARRRPSTPAHETSLGRPLAPRPPLISATLPSSLPCAGCLPGWRNRRGACHHEHVPQAPQAAETPRKRAGSSVSAPGQHVAHLTYLGLYALQHRGQESAGMAVSDGHSLTVVKDMGLVSNAFDDRTLAGLSGHAAIGHTRYSTTGSSTWRNAQPVYRDVGRLEFALGHNGNLVNTEALADGAGMLPGTVTSDSDLIAEPLAHELAGTRRCRTRRRGTARGALNACSPISRAFSLVLPMPSTSSACATPTASVPSASGVSTAAGCSPPNRPRSTSSARTSSVSSTPARWSSSTRQVRGRCVRSRSTESSPSSACSSSSTSPGLTRSSTARACTRPGCAWASSSPSRRRSRPTW